MLDILPNFFVLPFYHLQNGGNKYLFLGLLCGLNDMPAVRITMMSGTLVISTQVLTAVTDIYYGGDGGY